MSKVKAFGIWLASCVIQHEMSDTEIISKFHQRGDTKGIKNSDEWLQKQISNIRSDPEKFRSLMSLRRDVDF